jgi:hypothetical protein
MLTYFLALYLANILTFYLTFDLTYTLAIWPTFSGFIWHSTWHSI